MAKKEPSFFNAFAEFVVTVYFEGVPVSEIKCLIIYVLLNILNKPWNELIYPFERNDLFFQCIAPCNLNGSQRHVPWTNCNPDRNSLDFPFGKLEPGPYVIPVIQLYSQTKRLKPCTDRFQVLTYGSPFIPRLYKWGPKPRV